jgi:hypothetical protein
VTTVRVIVAHVTADGVRLDERVLDSLDIALVVHELRELVARVADAEAKPGPALRGRLVPSEGRVPGDAARSWSRRRCRSIRSVTRNRRVRFNRTTRRTRRSSRSISSRSGSSSASAT